MKNIFFVIFLRKFLRKTCWPPALEHGGHLDPRTPCHILCPPVSETHKGGSSDLEKAGRSKHHRSQEGRKEVKGMERTRAPGEDQLHLSGAVQKQDALGRRGLMLTKQEKRYRYSLQTCMHVCTNKYACVYTHVYTWFYSIWNVLKAEVEVEDMDALWMEGWTLLWAGRKLGHVEDRKPVTGEMIIVLLYVSYTWEWEKYRKY